MKITIKATGVELTPPIKEFIEDKVGSVQKFLQRFDENGQVLAEVEIGRPSTHHNKGEVYFAEINISLSGKMLRAKAEDADIRVAINKTKDILKREIDKFKDAHANH
ncbi:MAG: ribosome-associated translation inhibitor RaiA [bacterium]|nr:ribosome-associated translation inhibitor RaiA [bacterium]